jgi:PAS domain S-box-containing protein
MARGVLDGGPATWHEHLLVPADRSGFGEEASFSFSYSPIPTDTRAVGGVLVTAKVQGERTRPAEVKLHESEGRYLALFNSIDQGFCTLEVAFDESQKPADYRFLEVSPSFERQTGIRNGAGRWMREIAPGQDEHWFEIYGRVALTGESTRFESYSTPLGRWWAVYAFRIQEPRLRRVGVLFNDITERKRIEQALNDRTAQFQTLVNMAPLGVYLVDGDFRIMHVNPIAASVFGAIEGGVEGRAFDEIMHMLWEQEYADEIVRLFRDTLESGESHVTPERAEFRADRRVTEYYEWRIERITMPDSRGNGGRGFGVVCYFRDISAQVRDRQAIRESEERYRGIVSQSLAGIVERTRLDDSTSSMTGTAR